MDTAVDEIAPGIFRLSTWIPGITEHGFTFNQFLLTGDEPFLFHTGQRFLFPQVGVGGHRAGDAAGGACDGSPSATSRPTSAAR